MFLDNNIHAEQKFIETGVQVCVWGVGGGVLITQ